MLRLICFYFHIFSPPRTQILRPENQELQTNKGLRCDDCRTGDLKTFPGMAFQVQVKHICDQPLSSGLCLLLTFVLAYPYYATPNL